MATALAALLLLLAGSGPPAVAAGPGPRPTRLALVDGSDGRAIAREELCPGERAVLRWRNSLFGVDVTEVFTAEAGGLLLTSVTFAVPGGGTPPAVRPEEVDDLYHTGGPFHAEGLARPVRRVTFRVGEIGRPRFTLGDRTIRFYDEVGFGGTVRLEVAPPGGRAATPAARACPPRRSGTAPAPRRP